MTSEVLRPAVRVSHAAPPAPRTRYLAAVAVLLIAVAGAQWWRSRPASRDNPGKAVAASTKPDYDYVVPAGTAAAIESGKSLSIMPEVLQAEVGQVIRIVNNDSEAADVGPFRVPARSTLVQRFNKAGTFVGFCVLSPTGSARIVVT